MITGTQKDVTTVAAERDKLARVPTPGYRPDLGHHVCPACAHAGKVARVDPPDYRCVCGWERGGASFPGCVGTLFAVEETATKDVYSTESTEALDAAITAAKAKPVAARTAVEKSLAAVTVKAVEEPKPIDPKVEDIRG